jgi:hypothetical protein
MSRCVYPSCMMGGGQCDDEPKCNSEKDEMTLLREKVAALEALIKEKDEALGYVVGISPSDGEPYACVWCDMGGAGYSTKGDGHHDDIRHICPVLKAQNAAALTPNSIQSRAQAQARLIEAAKNAVRHSLI